MRPLFSLVVFLAATASHAATTLQVELPAEATTGSAFTYTINALDGTSPDTAYTGTVHVTSSDPAATPFPFDYTFTPADAGTHTFTATMGNAGSGAMRKNQTVTATDTSNASVTGSDTLSVKWASDVVRRIQIDLTSPQTRTMPFNVTVTAQNADFQTVPSFTGTVHFAGGFYDTAGGTFTLPADYTFTAADQGVHTFSVTANHAGRGYIGVGLVGEPTVGNTKDVTIVCAENELTATASNDGPMCRFGPGETLMHVVTNHPVTRYSWQSASGADGGDDADVVARFPATWIVTVTDANGCRVSSSTVVEEKVIAENPRYELSATPSCSGMTTATLTNAERFTDFEWVVLSGGSIVSGQGTPSATFLADPGVASMSIRIRAIDQATFCSTGFVGGVVLIGPAVDATIHAPSALCSTEAQTASVAAGENLNYEWSITNGSIVGGVNTPTIQFIPSGSGDVTLSVLVRHVQTNCSDQDAVTIPIGGPRAIVEGNFSACAGESVAVPVTLQGTPPFNITWSDGLMQNGINTMSFTRNVIAGEHTVYSITSLSDASCTGTSEGSATVEAKPAPSIDEQPQGTTINRGGTVTLIVDATGDALQFDWYAGLPGDRSQPVQSGASNSYVTPPLQSTTSYWVAVSNGCGSVESNAAVVEVRGTGRTLGRRRSVRH